MNITEGFSNITSTSSSSSFSCLEKATKPTSRRLTEQDVRKWSSSEELLRRSLEDGQIFLTFDPEDNRILQAMLQQRYGEIDTPFPMLINLVKKIKEKYSEFNPEFSTIIFAVCNSLDQYYSDIGNTKYCFEFCTDQHIVFIQKVTELLDLPSIPETFKDPFKAILTNLAYATINVSQTKEIEYPDQLWMIKLFTALPRSIMIEQLFFSNSHYCVSIQFSFKILQNKLKDFMINLIEQKNYIVLNFFASCSALTSVKMSFKEKGKEPTKQFLTGHLRKKLKENLEECLSKSLSIEKNDAKYELLQRLSLFFLDIKKKYMLKEGKVEDYDDENNDELLIEYVKEFLAYSGQEGNVRDQFEAIAISYDTETQSSSHSLP